jgi:hypothetical protein
MIPRFGQLFLLAPSLDFYNNVFKKGNLRNTSLLNVNIVEMNLTDVNAAIVKDRMNIFQ